MPSKYRIILEMASQTARDIASNADRYTDFLITAANNYKYSFKEQLLIHAQKPDATACAEIDTWNKLGRWVNKGTKGIALLIDRDVPYKLRHVFDISDTNSRAGRNITLWQMKPEYEYAVSESLQASFGDVEEPRDFPHLLIDISGYAVEDNLSDYLMELNAVKAGSFLEELDDTSLEAWLKTSLKSSVAFMALSRAGYEPRQYFDREDFSHLFDFNTVEVISVLGAAVSDISEMVIREMGETVREMEKEEKRKIRTFAQTGPSAYHKNRTENKERSNEHGTDLYDAGGLSDSRSDRAGEPEAWEVWNAAADIPPRAPGWDLHRDAAERNTEQSFGGGGPAGTEDAGRPDRADEGAERSDGAAEGGGSDAMGADDEFHSSLGGGSDSERPDLRVTLPTVEQQQEIIAEAEEEKSSAFAISQEDIDAILTRGSGIHQGKFRIYEQFLKQDSSENNITFLKNEYGIGGAYPAVSGRNLDESHDAKGIKISRGRISQPDAELLLRWNKVEKRIGELIRADRYLSQAEKDDYPAYREQAEARRKQGEISEEFRSIVYDYNDFVTQLGEENKALNLYYLSNCWSAFSVGNKKMYARTAEGDFILPMMCEAMNTIIADNTHLTARCEAMLEALNSDVAKPLESTFDELNPPPEPRKEYRYHLGDAVYIGTQEYELLSFDEKKVVLFDTQFPLFNKELTREEFDNRLKENPLNDRLLQVVEEPPVADNTKADQDVQEPEAVSDEELDALPISTVKDGEVVTYPNAEALLDDQEEALAPPLQVKRPSKIAPHVFDIWQRTTDRSSTQMVFCDLSTPHGDGKFNVYDDLRNKLIAKGVPAEEIAYIHTANSEAQKKELFGKVRSGQVRVLIGSTQKMGAGTNVQTKLAALHHLDCPWRPSDLQQREGRIIRQGNENKEVDIYTYVTENTFDSYLYQLVESKQKFIGQIMTSKSPVRSAEDIDETALSYAEIKALCAGNPHIKEKMDLDIDVSRLKLLKANHLSQRYSLEDQILKEFPQRIRSLEQRIEGYQADIDQRKRNTEPNEDGFSPMFMPGGTVREKKAAGDAILGLCKSMTSPDPVPIGQYRGFDMELSFDTFSREYKITLIHQLRHTVTLGTDIFGNIQRLDNTLGAFEERMAACAEQLENTRVQLENAKAEVQKPFPQEEELAAKTARLNELNALLNLDKSENEIVDGERGDEEPTRSCDDRER